MLVVLPPSETKMSGGDASQVLDCDRLGFPSQQLLRKSLVGQIVSLSHDRERAMSALKLGPKGAAEIDRNRDLRGSAVMPAISRYTGVLYDALGYQTLKPEARSYLHEHVAIFSALFGLIRATDLIPAYRLSFDSSLPQGKPGKQWAEISEALWSEVPGFVIDLRSEGYRALAPVPEGKGVFVHLVHPGTPGERKALGHRNKGVKGTLVRDLIRSRAIVGSIPDLVAWGEAAGYFFDGHSLGRHGIDLVVSGS